TLNEATIKGDFDTGCCSGSFVRILALVDCRHRVQTATHRLATGNLESILAGTDWHQRETRRSQRSASWHRHNAGGQKLKAFLSRVGDQHRHSGVAYPPIVGC